MPKKSLLVILAVLMTLPVLVFGSRYNHPHDAWLGIYTQTVDKDLMEAFDLDVDYGVVVKMVLSDSPAEKAGLHQGDIILKFENEKLIDSDDLVNLVGNYESGDDVEIVLIRDGEKKTLTVELGDRSDYDNYGKALDNYNNTYSTIDKNKPNSYSWNYRFDKSTYSDTYIGIGLENLNSQLGEYFGVQNGKGALITEVMEDSPAQKAGLKAGDVIIEVDNDEVDDLADVQDAVGEADEGDEIEVAILRNKKKIELTLEVVESPEHFYSAPNIVLPDIDDDFLFIPRMKGLFRGNFDDDFFDARDMEEWRENLEKEMKELRKELKELKENLR